jgi:hypothetical protein
MEMSYSRLPIISSAAPAAGTDAVIALSETPPYEWWIWHDEYERAQILSTQRPFTEIQNRH